MTVSEEPRLVEFDELLNEQEAEAARVAPLHGVLIAVAGVIGIAGLLTVLVVTAPALLDLATWISAINRAVNGG